MKNVITAENLRSFAYVNENALAGPPVGIAVNFMGLGDMSMFREDTPFAARLGAAGILYCIPYLDPWSWMNPFAVRETDEILEAIFAKYAIGSLPVVSVGGSMGGLACLVYTRYAKRTPVAVVANCPVCDLPYHYTERPDLPRTLYAAFGTSEAEDLTAAMEKASPLHLARRGEMPAIPYTVFHCTADGSVNKEMHSDRFVAELEKYAPVTYIPVPGRGHCDLGEEMGARYEQTVMDAFRSV